MVSNISKLTSIKTKIQYVIVYCLYLAAYLVTPLVVMQFINAVVALDYGRMVHYALYYLCAFALTQVISYAFSMMVGKVEAENFVNFFSSVNIKLKYLDVKDNDLNAGELHQQLGQNYEAARSYFFIRPMNAVFSSINVVAIFAIMFCLNWESTLILLVFVPCSFLASKAFEKKLYSSADENLGNIQNVKRYITDQFYLSKEERFLQKKQLGPIGPLLKKYRMVQHKNYKTKSVYLYFFTYCFLNLAILIVILSSGFLTYEGRISIGVLYAFQNYVSQLWDPCECLMSFSADYQQVRPALNGLSKLLNLTTADYTSEKIEDITLSNLTILDSQGKKLSKAINYTFQKGTTYVICGENGTGKTTLIEAIMGYNGRYCGDILINGKKLLSDDIVYISADAYISMFYSNEAGKLSSGQKKFEQIKLFLATDKSVYIFDEPTNFIDSNKKCEILDMISQLQKNNKLVIIVSHDPDFLKEENKTLKLVRMD